MADDDTGDISGDLSALQSGAVLHAPGDRELVVATGADRVRFLHGILTGDVTGAGVGGGRHVALLTPKAHVVSEMYVFVRADDVTLVVSGAGQAEPTAAALARFAIMDDVALAPRPDLGLLAVLGPGAAGALAAVGLGAAAGALGAGPLWSHVDAQPDAGAGATLWLARVRQLGAPGFWIVGAATDLARVAGDLAAQGLRRIGPAAAEAARVTAGEPAFGREITADYFPMEVGLGDAIDYGKGCFLGQEPIVRIRDRGHTNWRLARLDLEGASDPAPGDRLESDVKPKAGRLTSVARLPGGQGVALALVHIDVPDGGSVRVQHGDLRIPAVVRELPNPGRPA